MNFRGARIKKAGDTLRRTQQPPPVLKPNAIDLRTHMWKDDEMDMIGAGPTLPIGTGFDAFGSLNPMRYGNAHDFAGNDGTKIEGLKVPQANKLSKLPNKY